MKGLFSAAGVGRGDEEGWMMGGEKPLGWVSLAFTSLPHPTCPFWWSPSVINESILSFPALHYSLSPPRTAMSTVHCGQTAISCR